MNREKKDQLPAMQVSFIDSICFPVYDVSLHRADAQNVPSSDFSLNHLILLLVVRAKDVASIESIIACVLRK